MTEEEVAAYFDRLRRLALEAHLGLVELVKFEDGAAIIRECDPFAGLPVKGEGASSC